jgi:hypothetical protein
MAFVMANVHNPQVLIANLVEDVIRKAPQICATKTSIGQMKPQGIANRLNNRCTTSSSNSSASPGEIPP